MQEISTSIIKRKLVNLFSVILLSSIFNFYAIAENEPDEPALGVEQAIEPAVSVEKIEGAGVDCTAGEPAVSGFEL